MSKRASRWNLLLLLGLALGTLLVLLLFRDWMMDVLVVRVAYYLWVAGLVIRSRPQMLYWALPVIAGVVALMLLLAYNVNLQRTPRKPPLPVGYVGKWAEWLRSAKINPYADKYLYRRVARLTEYVLQWDAPAEAEADSGYGILQDPPPELVTLLRERHSLPDDHLGSPEKWGLEAIVTYLESVLEVDHDR